VTRNNKGPVDFRQIHRTFFEVKSIEHKSILIARRKDVSQQAVSISSASLKSCYKFPKYMRLFPVISVIYYRNRKNEK